jgi:methylmalonyl-CoA/ethylmalonyl-CoA epimerase
MEAGSSAAAESFGLTQLGQIALTVTDVGRALEFYRDTLGMKLLFQVPNLAFFDCAGVRLMLSGAETAPPDSGSVLYYRVPDIHGAYDTLSARGLAFEQKPHLVARMPDHELWMAFFRDPDRNLLAIMSEMPLS